MSKFSDWTKQRLERTFGLRRLKTLPDLEDWFNSGVTIEPQEKMFVEYLLQISADRMDDWNEEELKFKFIGPLVTTVNFETEHFSAFANRTLQGVINGETLNGLPDLMVAAGRQDPEMPYFCLHEYKKESGSDGDPGGQCLAAMLVAQERNLPHGFPIYGCYVIGRFWFFMILKGKEYAVSIGHNAGKNEIFDIFKALKTLKINITKQYFDLKVA